MVEGLNGGAPAPPAEIKPGVFTSEFWQTVAAAVASGVVVLLALFRVPADSAAGVAQAVQGGLIGLGALLAAAWTVANFIKNRAAVKTAAIYAAAEAARPADGKAAAPLRFPRGV